MSLKSGKCDSCGSTDICSNKNSGIRGERGQIFFGSLKRSLVDTYVCMKCGKFEEYVNDIDFQDDTVLEKIRKEWQQVEKR